jgi:iron complex transport system substrate-binding protein
MAAGNWTPDLVELAGGVNLFGSSGTHSSWLTWKELVANDPAVMVIMPCGFDIRRTRAELPNLARQSEWTSLRAVRDGRVYLVDGNQYFNRPGPRLIDSLEIMAEILHPKLFKFAREGKGWERL